MQGSEGRGAPGGRNPYHLLLLQPPVQPLAPDPITRSYSL